MTFLRLLLVFSIMSQFIPHKDFSRKFVSEQTQVPGEPEEEEGMPA